MSEATTTSAMSIIIPILTMIIGSVLTIIFTPFKNWFYSNNENFCVFSIPFSGKNGDRNQITITKKFGKVTNINCLWFNRIETEYREYNGMKYFYCIFGESLDPKNKDRELKKCPFV